jgi:hypothetical protein
MAVFIDLAAALREYNPPIIRHASMQCSEARGRVHWTFFLVYFSYFEEMTGGLCDLHALCVTHLTTFEWLNQSV